MSVPFQQRNPVVIGAISIAVIILMMLLAFNASKLPLIGGGTTYYANFSEAGGLISGNEVRIAGVRVGKVTSMQLDGNKVRVAFQISTNARLGDLTQADIKVKTMLGQMYLSLEPQGPGQLKSGATIPLDRTQSPYNIVDVFSGLASRAHKMDINQVRNAINDLAAATKDTPANFRGALQGLSQLSANVAARDQELNSLLTHTHVVATILSERSGDIVGLMRDANTLLNALYARRAAVHRLLVSTATMSSDLTTLVNGSRRDIKPALDQLQGVTDLLLKNQANLDASLRLMAPFYRVFANTLGNGPWFDTWIQNMPPVPSAGG